MNTDHIFECMKKRYTDLAERELICKDKLENISIENGYLLPVRKRDGKFMMGRGGVFDHKKKFVPLSGIYSRGNSVVSAYEGSKLEVYMGEGYSFNDEEIADEKIEGTCVYLGFVHNHWGHFLIDFSTRLWYARESGDYDKLIFLVKDGQDFEFIPNIRRFLELYGIDENRILFVNKVSRFEKLIIPEPSYRANDYYSKKYLEMFDIIAGGVSVKSDFGNIYFSRGSFKKASATEFGGEMVDDSFVRAGFKMVYPEKCTLDEQISYIRGADVVAGVSGTVTHNMLFAKHGARLIIINKTYIMNVMQSDINLMRELDVTYVDAYSALFPVSMGIGPFLFEPTDEFEAFFKNGYKVKLKRRFLSDRRLHKNFREYCRTFEKLSVNNYLVPAFDDDEGSAHYYSTEHMKNAIKKHYLHMNGKLRRRNILRRILKRG